MWSHCPHVQAELPDLSYDRERASDPAGRAREGDEEPISGRIDLVAPVQLELLPDSGVVGPSTGHVSAGGDAVAGRTPGEIPLVNPHLGSPGSCRPDPRFIRPAAVRVARVGKGLEGGERASDLGKWLATSAWLVSRYSGP